MKKVGVFGSISTDFVATTQVLPNDGETVVGDSFSTQFGGKGANKAVALSRLGKQVVMFGAVGDDEFSRRALANLKQEKVDVKYVKRLRKQVGGIATIFSSQKTNMIVMVPGANGEIDEKYLKDVENEIKKCDCIVAELEVPQQAVLFLSQLCKKHNIKFVEAPGAGWTDNPFQVQTMCLAERINYTTNAYYYWRRVNLYESDDLKDWTIPFKRSEEIHNWLETNNINDENILFSLMRREFAYIGIVLGMRKISKSSECYKCIKKMLSRYSEEKILNSKKLREDEKNFYKSLKHLKTFRFKILSKRTRREYISIRFNSREKSLRIKDKIISFTK